MKNSEFKSFSDRLKVSSSHKLFGNMLDLEGGIFLETPHKSASYRPLSKYLSELLTIQDNLPKASAKEFYLFI